MTDYKGMYRWLYNQVTEAITLLQTTQQECEEMYIESTTDEDDPPPPAQIPPQD